MHSVFTMNAATETHPAAPLLTIIDTLMSILRSGSEACDIINKIERRVSALGPFSVMMDDIIEALVLTPNNGVVISQGLSIMEMHRAMIASGGIVVDEAGQVCWTDGTDTYLADSAFARDLLNLE